jgi:hypothetical protein
LVEFTDLSGRAAFVGNFGFDFELFYVSGRNLHLYFFQLLLGSDGPFANFGGLFDRSALMQFFHVLFQGLSGLFDVYLELQLVIF